MDPRSSRGQALLRYGRNGGGKKPYCTPNLVLIAMCILYAREKCRFCETNPISPPSMRVPMVYAHDPCAAFLAFFCEANPISPSLPFATQQKLCHAEDRNPEREAGVGN